MDETAAQGSASAGVRRMPAGCALARPARGGSSDATRAAERRHPPLVPCIGPANPRPLPSTVTPRTGRDRAFTPHPAASALREGWRDCDCTPYPAVPSLAARLWGLLPCPSCDIMWSVRRDGEALGWPSADLGRDLGRLSGGPRRARRRSVQPTHVRVEGGSLGRSRPISADLSPISRRSVGRAMRLGARTQLWGNGERRRCRDVAAPHGARRDVAAELGKEGGGRERHSPMGGHRGPRLFSTRDCGASHWPLRAVRSKRPTCLLPLNRRRTGVSPASMMCISYVCSMPVCIHRDSC